MPTKTTNTFTRATLARAMQIFKACTPQLVSKHFYGHRPAAVHSWKKQEFSRLAILLFTLLGTYSSGLAQKNNSDYNAVGSQFDAFIASWNRHDFSDMKNYVAEECDFVNPVGMHWKGRKDIQFSHQAYHEHFFKTTPMEKRSVAIRFLKPDVAVAQFHFHLGASNPPDGSNGNPGDGLGTFVFVKTDNRWLMTSVEIVGIDENAKPFNPVTMRDNPKGKQ